MASPTSSFAVAVRPLALAVAGALLALAAVPGQAQVAPSAGDVLRETSRPVPTPPRNEPVLPKAEPVRPALQAASGFRMTLGGFRITGNSAIKETDLQILLTEFLGQQVGLAELQSAADAISRHYRDRGYFVARAYLPQQEIQGGIVEIAVLEGKVGQATAKIGGTARTQPAVAQRLLDASVKPGDTVHERPLERAALLVNDLPGMSASISLEPGAATGQTNVTLNAEEGALANVQIDADNHGNRFTGQNRLGGTLVLNSPLKLADQFSLRLMKSDGDLDLLRLTYQVPVGSSGLRMGASYSKVDFTVCCQIGLTPGGGSDNYSLFANYPLVRQRDLSVYLNAVIDRKDTVNKPGVGADRERNLDVLTLGGSVESRDSVGGGGFNYGNLALGFGRLGIRDAADAGADAAGPRAADSFRKIALQAARTQRLGERISLYAGLNGQWAGKNLDSAEKFTLGGASGVRAYPSGEASGDDGTIAQVELRADLPINGFNALWQGFLFYDHGQITVNHTQFVAGGLTPNNYSLKGWGLGLNITRAGLFQVRGMWATKIGDNPGRNLLTGADADGRSDRSRFWLQAVTLF